MRKNIFGLKKKLNLYKKLLREYLFRSNIVYITKILLLI